MGTFLGRRAFTLVELMVVVAIIGVLVALLMPALSTVGVSAGQMRCAANLHRLWQAISVRAADEASQENKRMLRGTVWPAQVLPYLESGPQMMLCPAGGESLSGDSVGGGDQNNIFQDGAASGEISSGSAGANGEDRPPTYARLSDLADVKTDSGTTSWFVPLEEGRWCLKLSDAQYAAARAANLLNDSDNSNNITTKFNTAYQSDGNRYSYWLCVEDHGGDDDFKDVMIHVTENRDGSFSLDISAGGTGHRNSIVNKPEGRELALVASHASGVSLVVRPSDDPGSGGYAGSSGPGGWHNSTQETDPLPTAVVTTSYAMNAFYPQMTRKGSKILLMDYIKYLAYVNDDWGDEKFDPPQMGVPLFARHNGRFNVLYSDGSVVAEDPEDIDPAFPMHERLLWKP